MAAILFYSPFNQRSRDTESLMIAFHQQGHRVLSLSQAEGNFIHEYLQTQGIETFSHVIEGRKKTWYYLQQIVYFIRFCRLRKIDVVYSHLESANFVAALAQYFVRAAVYICRHHVDLASLSGFDKSLFYRTTYTLAKKIIVVSEHARKYMVEREGINPQKIIHINLAYDFSLYPKPDLGTVKSLKEKYASRLILITTGRLTKPKRVSLSVQTLQKIRKQGVDAILFILGSGEDEGEIMKVIRDCDLTENVILPGHVRNITDYFAAANFLLHPSVSESSCVVVKEAAITDLPVIACHGVGDFDDYMVHEQNAFLTSKEKFVEEAADLVLKNYDKVEKLHALTQRFHEKVTQLFSLENVIPQYEKLNRGG